MDTKSRSGKTTTLFGNAGTAADAAPASITSGVKASPSTAVAPMPARTPRRRAAGADEADVDGDRYMLEPLLESQTGERRTARSSPAPARSIRNLVHSLSWPQDMRD